MRITLDKSVGTNGQNLVKDVKVVQALVNVYLRSNGRDTHAINGLFSQSLAESIGLFQKDTMGQLVGGLLTNSDPTFKGLQAYLERVFIPLPISPPSKGRVTWDAEGREGGAFHSRRLHVPSGGSGLTIGRGFDMKQRGKQSVFQSLFAAGISQNEALKLSSGAGLFGSTAFDFIISNDLLDYQISPLQQLRLFEQTYDEIEKDVVRISSMKAVVLKYGEIDWAKLNSKIKDILVDMRFRGDYTPITRNLVQGPAAKNNLKSFCSAVSESFHLTNVPSDRIRLRTLHCRLN